MSRRAPEIIEAATQRGLSKVKAELFNAALTTDAEATVAAFAERYPRGLKREAAGQALREAVIALNVGLGGALPEACALQAISRRLIPDLPRPSRRVAEALFSALEEAA